MSNKNDENKKKQESQEPINGSTKSAFDLDANDLKRIAEKRKQENAIAKGFVTREQLNEEAKRPPRPGALKMTSEVAMHTQLGVALFYGRKGNQQKRIAPIVGLARFAKKVAEVWRAAGEDDPYADYVLLCIEDTYKTASARLERMTKDVEVSVKEDIEMIISTDFMESKKPTVLKTEFACPWAWRGLKLLKAYDHLVRMALAGRHIGLYTNEDWQAIVYESARGIRHMFIQAEKWMFTGIGRENIVEDDDYAKQAYETYLSKNKRDCLSLDDDVINGKRRARLSPEIKGNPRAVRYRAMRKMKKKADAEEVKTMQDDIKRHGGEEKENNNAKKGEKKTLKLKKNVVKES